MTQDKSDKIEIGVDLKLLGEMNFWIDRVEWDAMSEEARNQRIEEKVDDLLHHWENLDLTAPRDGTPVLRAGSFERDERAAVTTYDPDGYDKDTRK